MGTSVSLCRAPLPAWGPAGPGANREAVFCSQANRRPVSTTGQTGPQTWSLEPARLPTMAAWSYRGPPCLGPSWGPVLGPCPWVGAPGVPLWGPGRAGGLKRHCVLAWGGPLAPEPQVASLPGDMVGPCPASPAHHTLGSAPPGDQDWEATGLGTPGVGSSLGLGPAMLVPRLLGPLRTHAGGDAQTCRLGGAVGGAMDRSDSRKVARGPVAPSRPRGRPRCSQGGHMAH